MIVHYQIYSVEIRVRVKGRTTDKLHMHLKFIFAAIPMLLLSSCCTTKLAEANKNYMNNLTEIRDDSKAEGYLVSTKGGTETFRFRNVLHEEKDSPRTVEISVPEDRTKNRSAEMREVDAPYEPKNKTRYSLRVVQQKETYQQGSQFSLNSRELIIGKDVSNPRLFLGPQGRHYTNHLLKTDLRKVHRSDVVAGLRCLGYAGTSSADALIAPVYFSWFIYEFH